MPGVDSDRSADGGRRGVFAVLAGIGISIALRALPAAAQAADPAGRIGTLHAALIETMKQARQLPPRERYDKLAPVIRSSFDVAGMIRVATGPGWEQATPTQRAALTEAFARVMTASYVSRFKDFAGEKFEILGTADQPPSDKRVRTRIVPASGDPVDIDYLMRNTAEGWKIADVYVNGSISELSIRRNEYSGIARASGPDGLAAALTRKSEQLLGG